MPKNLGGILSHVIPGSVGHEIGLEPGDRILAINGHPLRDVIDYRFYGADEELELIILREDQEHRLEIERDYDEDLGLEFTEPVFDGMRQCQNQCPFCFVRQMPRGMRRSLYLRDDDYRYSFLWGNFITLTNLMEADWERIDEQRLSPLYVSVHATDTETRRLVLGNPTAPDIMPQLRRLQSLGIEVHAQIVLSPGVNDGPILTQSIHDLSTLWPTVNSLAVVPVGLTRFHSRGIRLLNRQDALLALDLIDNAAREPRQEFASTWLFPSDELYLLAGTAIPSAGFYDTDAQRENGVGLVRELLDAWEMTKQHRRRPRQTSVRQITLVCGELIAPTLTILGEDLASWARIGVHVITVPNTFFGTSVTVSGLLTGQDVLEALRGHELGQRVYLPRSMFDESGQVTLDDMDLATLTEGLGATTIAVATMGEVVESLNRAERR